MTVRFASLGITVFVALFLAACASVMQGEIQTITLKTPGETEVMCLLDNGTLQYKFYSGDTKNVTRNAQDIQASCYAPGNREKHFTIPWIVEPWTVGNVVNGIVPGVTYDVLNKAAFAYPDIVTVDFGGQSITTYKAPDYIGPKYIKQEVESYAPGSVKGESSMRKKTQDEMLGQNNPFNKSSSSTTGGSGTIPLTALPPSPYPADKVSGSKSEEK